MNTRSALLRATPTLVFLAALALGVAPALAVHTNIDFELDGNAVNSGAAPPDDWDIVLGFSGGVAVPPSGNDSLHVFATGETPNLSFVIGTKDLDDVSSWHWDEHSVPDKDLITHAYAARYANGILYFGADRFANNGDAQMGFWFFQNPVSINPDGSFSGVHAVGDLLIISNFVKGGGSSNIQVWEWVGSGGSDGTLNLIADTTVSGSLLVCNTASGTTPADSACAIANGGGDTAPWPYTPKSGPSGIFPDTSFIEGGVDLNALGLGDRCFASFMAETRSSQSVTAALKDFLLQEFEECDFSIGKVCTAAISPDGTSVTVDVTATVTTPDVDATNVTVTDDKAGALAGPTTIPAGASANYIGSYTTTAAPPYTDTATATLDLLGTMKTHSASATCEVQRNPAISVTKECTAALNPDGASVTVTFGGQVCNAGNVALSGVSVANAPQGGVTSQPSSALAPGACSSYSGSYTSSSLSNTDTVTATGTGALGSGAVSSSASASCSAAVTKGIEVTKTCNLDLQIVTLQGGAQAVAVLNNINGTVCNTGTVALSGVTLSNDQPGTTFTTTPSSTLGPGQCAPYAGKYTPTNISLGDLLTPSTAAFTDQVTATGTAAFGLGDVSDVSDPATCFLCQ